MDETRILVTPKTAEHREEPREERRKEPRKLSGQGNQEGQTPDAENPDKTVIKRPESRTLVLDRSDKTLVVSAVAGAAPPISQPLQRPLNKVATPKPLKPAPGRSVTVGDCIKGRFDLLEVLGVGGMGVVYRARDRRQKELGESDPHLALKVLNEQLQHNESALVALQQECRKSQRLAHPNIVNVYDFDRDNRLAFMTMELLHGQSLDAVLYAKEFNGAPLDAIAPRLKQIASALQYAHDKGIIHSDFKPSNLFLTEEGGIKIFDFGIARVMQTLENGAATTPELSALTPAYASLGMLTDQPPAAGDDLYAFAVVIYFWLTGRHPYQRKTALQVQQQKLVPVRPRGIPDDAWKMLRTALDPVRGATLSVAEFMAGFLPEPDRLSPRYKWGISLAGVLALCLSGYFGFFAWQDSRYADDLGSNDRRRIQASLSRLAELPQERRRSIIQSEREALIDHAMKWVAQAEQRGDFHEGLGYLDRFLALFPDSQKLFHRYRELSRTADAQAQELAQAVTDYETRLLRMTPQEALQWVSDLERLQRTNPSHELLAPARLTRQLGPLLHSQLFLGQTRTVTELLAHPLFQNLDGEQIDAWQRLAAGYRSSGGVALMAPKSAAKDVPPILTEAERQRLQSAAELDSNALEALLDQIEQRRPEFAEAFRWAMQARRKPR